jgi:hypothetical protein
MDNAHKITHNQERKIFFFIDIIYFLTFYCFFYYNIGKLLAGEESSLAPLPFLNLGASTASIPTPLSSVQLALLFPTDSPKRFVLKFASMSQALTNAPHSPFCFWIW